MSELEQKEQGELIVSEDYFALIQEMDALALPTYQK
mgnify:FL=1